MLIFPGRKGPRVIRRHDVPGNILNARGNRGCVFGVVGQGRRRREGGRLAVERNGSRDACRSLPYKEGGRGHGQRIYDLAECGTDRCVY